jgi:lipopolysaccharide export system protein LptA
VKALVAIAAGLIGLTCLVSGPLAQAQGIGLPGQHRKLPLEINADNGIEWRKEVKAYIARGNARAAQGDVAVHARVLTAYYRDEAEGGSRIWRIDADGDVRIVAPNQTAYGDKAVYDVQNGVLVLTGKTRLVTATDRITARDSLEFWEKRNLAVARGDAVAIRGDNRLRADVLTAHLIKGKGGKTRLRRIDAFDNVFISSPTEIARGDQGRYDVDTGIAILSGSVKITRGENQLHGDYAEVNLNTGVSRLFGSGRQGVTGYFSPHDVKKDRTRQRKDGDRAQ